MPTEVPYTGTFQIAPKFEPTPSINVQATPAAFGVNVAEAVQHLGEVQKGAGQELFDRAYAMQELHEHASANAALADSQNQMDSAFVNFRQLEGKQATDGYKDFQDNINQIRSNSGKNLSPYAQELYDQESRAALQRTNFSGAIHAADEGKKYIVGAADASIAASTKTMQADPNNPAVTEAALKNIRDQVAHKFGDIGGMSPGEVKQKQADAVNEAVNGRIRSLANTDPIGAQKLMDQAIKDGDLYGNDVTNLSWYVKHQRDTVGARTISQRVLDENRMNGGPVLRALFKNEDAGMDRDIENPVSTTSGHAQGYFQITTGTWREMADKAGIDLREYPQAKGSTYSVQAQVANVIPLSRWDPTTIARMRAAGAKLDLSKTLGENLAMNGEGLGNGITPKPTLQDSVNRSRALANQQFPGDNDFADAAENFTITQYNKTKAIERDTAQNNYETVSGALLTPMQSGHLPATIDELAASSPDAKASLDWIASNEPSKMQTIQRQLLANSRDPIPFNQERQDAYLKLVGMAGSEDQRQAFLDKDPMTLDLPFAQKLDILKLQQKVQKQADESVPMARALMLLGPKLNAMGLTKQQDPDNLNLFRGAMTKIMEDFMAENKRPPKNDEIEKIGSELLQQTATQGYFGTKVGAGVSSPWFQKVIEDADPKTVDMIRQTYQKQGVEPTDFDINRTLLRLEFKDKFSKPTAPSGASSAPPKPQAQQQQQIKGPKGGMAHPYESASAAAKGGHFKVVDPEGQNNYPSASEK